MLYLLLTSFSSLHLQYFTTQDTEIKLFQAFLPQLCRRTKAHDLNAIARLMTANPFIIEEKLDGERMQLHMRGGPNGEFFWCSRKGKDYSEWQ